MKNNTRTILSLIICAVFLTNCNSNNRAAPVNHGDSVRLDAYAFNTGNGWGYTITADNKPFIKQEVIPAIQGFKSFATQADAEKVASLVITKIKQHKKPTIFVEDLKALKIVD